MAHIPCAQSEPGEGNCPGLLSKWRARLFTTGICPQRPFLAQRFDDVQGETLP